MAESVGLFARTQWLPDTDNLHEPGTEPFDSISTPRTPFVASLVAVDFVPLTSKQTPIQGSVFSIRLAM